jgi:hypothetical protein
VLTVQVAGESASEIRNVGRKSWSSLMLTATVNLTKTSVPRRVMPGRNGVLTVQVAGGAASEIRNIGRKSWSSSMLTVTVNSTRRNEQRLVRPGADNRRTGTGANANRGGGAEKLVRSRGRTVASLMRPEERIPGLPGDCAELESGDRHVGQVVIVERHAGAVNPDGPKGAVIRTGRLLFPAGTHSHRQCRLGTLAAWDPG